MEGYSARELREGARGLVDPNVIRRIVVELEDLAEAAARAVLLPVELASRLPAAALLAAWWFRRPARKRR